jgi:hypothetical protein
MLLLCVSKGDKGIDGIGGVISNNKSWRGMAATKREKAVHVHVHVNVHDHVNVHGDVDVNVDGFCHAKILSRRARIFVLVVQITNRLGGFLPEFVICDW